VNPYAKRDACFSIFRYDKAFAAYEEGVKKDPKNQDAEIAYYRIAHCYGAQRE